MPSSLFIIRFAGFTIHDKVCVLNLEDAFKVNACTCHIKYRLSVTQNVPHALIKEHKGGGVNTHLRSALFIHQCIYYLKNELNYTWKRNKLKVSYVCVKDNFRVIFGVNVQFLPLIRYIGLVIYRPIRIGPKPLKMLRSNKFPHGFNQRPKSMSPKRRTKQLFNWMQFLSLFKDNY